MAWYVTQSLLTILATFVLGLIVGWLWWGRVWRRVPFGESDALHTLSDRYRAMLAERDAEIDRLGQLGSSRQPSVTDPGDGDPPGPAAPGPGGIPLRSSGTAVTEPADTEPDAGPPGPGSGDGEPGTPEVEPVEPDDLQRIEGIGPRIATALADAGLDSYRAIAVADSEQLSEALRASGLSFAPSLVTWPLQARLLASGDERGLATLQAKLTAGRALPTPPTPPTPSDPAEPPDAGTIGEGAIRTSRDADGGDRGPGVRGGPGPGAAEPGPGDSGASEPGPGDSEEGEDELERVEGIGPRIATALRKAGIRTYRQLASTDPATLQAALAASGLRFTPSLPTWSRQAALLADGDEAGFLELTRTLIPERESGRPS